MECPSCEGSGLIGGYKGQKNQYEALDTAMLTAAERKRIKAALRLKFQPPPKKTKETRDRERIEAMKLYVARGGPKAKAEKAPKYSMAEVLRLIGEEGKELV